MRTEEFVELGSNLIRPVALRVQQDVGQFQYG
jgi:hypothetical protein